MDEDTPDVRREMSVDMLDGHAGTSERATPSTAATSTTSVPRPSAEEMFHVVYKARMETKMVKGDVWYIISGPWLIRFLQSHEGGNSLSKEDVEGELGPIDNSGLVDLEKGNSDEELLGSEELVPIKPGNFGEDFEIVPENVWDSLVSWYGLAQGSPIIKRRVVDISEEGDEPNLQFEYYPPKFTLFKLRDPSSVITKDSLHNEKSQSPKEFIATKDEKYQKFLQKVKKLADVELSRKIRLWKVLGGYTEEGTEATPLGVKKPNKGKAPGTFDKLVIDLQAFLELQPGSERELVNLPDSSNNSNYNGSLRIGTAGFGAGGIIVIEEQSSDGEWITDKNVKSVTKFGQRVTVPSHGKAAAITPSKKTTSRSSSPSASSVKSSPSKISIVRGRREGRPQGKCGLSNLGNTCYMNSALQCLRSVKELSRYFISDEYEKELNPSNPLAHHGKVAKAYAGLLKNIFSPTCPASFAPREFKTTIGRFGPSFQGYGQQDSQEFLAFLLDGLHEDLNRIQKKPYIEKPESTDEMVGDMEAIAELASEHWDIYKKRNDSAVADLFGGLYQSTLVCPVCEKVSITFDPFMDLTLPLPVENVWSKEVFFIPKDDSKGKLLKIPVEMDKNGSIKSLKEYVGKKMGIDPRMIMASEVYRNRFFKHYDDSATVADQIQHNDDAYLYELEDIPTNWPSKNKKPKKSLYYGASYRFDDDEEEPLPGAPETERLLVPVFNKVYKESKFTRSTNSEGFAFPFFIVVNREEAKSLDAIMSKIVERYQLMTSRNLYEDVQGRYDENEGLEEADDVVEVNEHKAKVAGDDEQEEDDKDGFVNVSMKDAGSVQDSENADEAEGGLLRKASKRGLPDGLQDLFSVKVSKRKSGESSLLTGWQSLEASLDIRDRLNPNTPPTPPPRKPSVFPIGGNSGRRSPAESLTDDGIDNYEDAPEPELEGDMMQDASDDEENTQFEQGTYQRQNNGVFATIADPSLYGNSSANSSTKAFKTPSRTPSPTILEENPLIKWGEGLICEWTESGWDAIFGGKGEDEFRGRAAWNDITVYNDPELYSRRRRREDRKNKGIHLEDCLDEFAKNEVLSEEDPWYCPRCKVHRRATKKFELWKCPDILVIHLKRFSSSRNFRDKIDVLIDCPVEGLDLSNRVGLKEQDHGLIYDLIAVDNHYGGLGGGHYTAYAKNWIDNKWYYCDDSSVREVLDADKVITPAAYLLFYRRRASHPLGGPHYERLLNVIEATSEDSADETGSSRGTSPNRAGEGGPSGDQIRGSSGSGVSGFSRIYSDEVGNGKLWGREPSSTTKVSDDEQLPPYSALKPDDSEESGVEMTSLLGTIGPQPVELSFTNTKLKDELIKDMEDSDPEAEVSSGGVFLQQTEQDDGESVDIVVEGEDTITPAPDKVS